MPGKIVIVGGGLSGLAAGIHARKAGYEVEVFEHHTEPGGVCTAWERGGYTIDGCIEWLSGSLAGHPFHQLYEETGALEGNTLVPLTSYTTFLDERSGQQLELGADLDRLLADVRAISRVDAPFFEEIVGVGRMIEEVSARGGHHPFHLAWDRRSMLPAALRFLRPMSRLVNDVENDFLREALRSLVPAGMPAIVLPFILGQLEAGQLSFVRGGSYRFSRAVAARLRKLGGELHLGSDVEEILVDHDRAIGVLLTDGRRVLADRVISTAPGYTTIFRLLGGKYTDRRIRERYARWPTFSPIALVSFGARRRWKELPYSWLLRLDDPLHVGTRTVEHLVLRTFRDDPTLAPPGCSVFQALVETDSDLWQDLHHAPRRYAAQKASLADAVMERVERRLPGVGAELDMLDVATPYTFWRFARTWRGAYEGWLPTREALLHRPRRTLPGLDRFHMAGQWVEPGGGVPSALMSGRQVIAEIVEADRPPPRREVEARPEA